MLKPKRIRQENFRRYGRVIGFAEKPRRDGKTNLFRKIIVEKRKTGWRLAYLVLRDKTISRLEQHLDTYESFEPVKGKGKLFLADKKDPAAIACFLLDQPVVLNKGIWHGLVALGRECEIKITENAHVRSIYWKLGRAML